RKGVPGVTILFCLLSEVRDFIMEDVNKNGFFGEDPFQPEQTELAAYRTIEDQPTGNLPPIEASSQSLPGDVPSVPGQPVVQPWQATVPGPPTGIQFPAQAGSPDPMVGTPSWPGYPPTVPGLAAGMPLPGGYPPTVSGQPAGMLPPAGYSQVVY